MDLAKVQSIRNHNSDDALKELLDKLPSSTGQYDRVSARLYGVLYNKEKTVTDVLQGKGSDIVAFLMSNLSQNCYINTKQWEQAIGKVLKSSGRMLEYILVDFMSRNFNYVLPENSDLDAIKFLYTKGTLEQDNEDKIDFLSTTSLIKGDRRSNFVTGMQLTTIDAPKHMEQNEINLAKEELFDKKMLIMQKLMHPVKNKKLPRNYQPDICGCMIVNGALQKQIHDVGNELLHDTFVQWQNNGYPYGGPTQFLPGDFKHELAKICKLYQYTQYDMLEKSLAIGGGKKHIHSIDTTSTDMANIHISYDDATQKITYEFFDKKRDTYNFMFSVAYFLQDEFLKSIIAHH